MAVSSELSVEVDSLDALNYRVTLKFTKGEATRSTPREVGPEHIRIAHEELRECLLAHDYQEYGIKLRDFLFAPPDIHTLFVEAGEETPLRVRLKLDTADPQLHALRWEMLAGPDGMTLSSKEGLSFSRYLASGREVTLRREPDELRALVVVVDPSPEDREKYGLSEIDVDFDRRAASLSPIPCDPLTSDQGPVTMNKLIAKLKEGEETYGGYDILYLVCHGAMVRGSPHLLLDLEGEEEVQNRSYFRSGEVLVRRLAEEVLALPRLVLLASCASAGTEDDNALAALGPLLAREGIPGVIAMQGFVQIQTVEEFIPAFFAALTDSGEVDRAMRVARNHVKNNKNYDDWWMPVLFMRLSTGSIWYTPGFDAEDVNEDKLWARVTNNIALRKGFDNRLRSHCTPILGPDFTGHLFGNHSRLASEWAKKYHFPLSPHHQNQLPRVLQYLKVMSLGEANVRLQFREQLVARLKSLYPALLGDLDAGIEEMIDFLWAQQLKDDPEEPHNILASLPFTCYITTDPTNALETALRYKGREPKVEIFNWQQTRSVERLRDEDHYPTYAEPIVFHAFGHVSIRKSLVLSEDDYFDYLINFIRALPRHFSSGVYQALTEASLLFLGFRMFRWDFRITFRSLLSQSSGGGMLEDYPHVAAQLSPEEGAFLNPRAARNYLIDYFKGAHPDEIRLDIYWGEVTDFLIKLQQVWVEEYGEQGSGTGNRGSGTGDQGLGIR